MKMKRQSRTRAERSRRRRSVLRMVISTVLLLLTAVPMLGGHIQPLPVIPALVCIAMNEDLYFSMFCGVLAGFLTDIACGSYLGANAIFDVLFVTVLWLLFTQLLHRGFLHFLWLTAAGTFLHAALRCLFAVLTTNGQGGGALWRAVLLPSALLTMLTALLVYVLYLPCGRLLNRRVRTMEQVSPMG